MNNVKIVYTYDGETKDVTLNEIYRFYETYNHKAKDLVMVVSNNNEYYVTDEVLAEMLQSEINTVALATNTNGNALNVTLSDYPYIRDIRKEYDFDEAQIRIQIIFEKTFDQKLPEGEKDSTGV
jgi:hypothetical protein